MAESQDTPTEEWRPVPGWEAIYSVSNLGRLKRIDYKREKLLSPCVNADGYRQCCLSKRGVKPPTNILLHQLVASAFLGPMPPGKEEVNHKNADKVDNRSDNLEYVTSGENCRHAAKLGLKSRGERHWHSHLSESDAREIRRLYVPYAGTLAIARRYGIDCATVRMIAAGRSWKHLNP